MSIDFAMNLRPFLFYPPASIKLGLIELALGIRDTVSLLGVVPKPLYVSAMLDVEYAVVEGCEVIRI
jgi:hypothetical protein